MHLITLLATAATALAVVIPRQSAAPPEGYHWEVENWSAGCARSGCTYSFNVTGPKDGIYPSFKANCYGQDSGFFDDCTILEAESTSGVPSVTASLQPQVIVEGADSIAAMGVSLSFLHTASADTVLTVNATGFHNATYNAFVAPVYGFCVTPSEFTAVA